MNTQELFDNAAMRYNDARNLIGEMGAYVLKSNPQFKIVDVFCEFDIIIQYILLEIALADGKFLEIEGEFIDKITDTYDILYLFNNNDSGKNWSYAGANMVFPHIRYVIHKVEELADGHLRDFAKFFAAVDSEMSNKDYMSELIACVKDIAVAFILCDGNGDQNEVKTAVQVVKQCLIQPLLTYMAKSNE